MISIEISKGFCRFPSLQVNSSKVKKSAGRQNSVAPSKVGGRRKLLVKACGKESEKKAERRSFLSLEEAGLVEISGLSTHERFLCRLTVSSLNLLRIIADQEGCPIEELNAGRVCDWFLKDKLKREQNSGTAELQWDDSELQF